MRTAAVAQILVEPVVGRRPTLQVILDLTTLEKLIDARHEIFSPFDCLFSSKSSVFVCLINTIKEAIR